ncbi:MAG: radical SAM protein [Lachnospiraceae bacterium]|nr:radical SAM protein [Lachnospiraceae bacterium]
MQRYAKITEKNPREIVLLRGQGCRYRRCTFCDYYEDASPDAEENLRINRQALAQVTGEYGVLEAINSGSFTELDPATVDCLEATCRKRGIHTLHLECHWLYRREIPAMRQRFQTVGVTLRIKQGVETFDPVYREQVMKKGIRETDPAKIAEGFDECCLLLGLPGQTTESMRTDIETGLAHFDRVCVNLMTENGAPLQPDAAVRACFLRDVEPFYRDNPRVDILRENTDFGVGGEEHE